MEFDTFVSRYIHVTPIDAPVYLGWRIGGRRLEDAVRGYRNGIGSVAVKLSCE